MTMGVYRVPEEHAPVGLCELLSLRCVKRLRDADRETQPEERESDYDPDRADS